MIKITTQPYIVPHTIQIHNLISAQLYIPYGTDSSLPI